VAREGYVRAGSASSGAAPAAAEAAPRIRLASDAFGFANVAGSEFSNATTEVSSYDRVTITLNGFYRSLGAIVINNPTNMFAGTRVGNALIFNAGFRNPSNNRIIPFDFGPQPIAHVSTAATKGRSGYVLGDGQLMISKLAPLCGAASGAAIRTQKYHSVGLGQRWAPTASGSYPPFTAQQTGSLARSTSNLYVSTNNDQSDQNIVGATETASAYTDTACRYWGPIAYIGEQITPTVVVYVMGHSIPYGSGNGYVKVGLDAAGIKSYNAAIDGYTLAAMAQNDYARQTMAEYCDYVYAAQVITNDWAGGGVLTLAAAKALYKEFVRGYSRGHNRIILGTETPHTTSTDGWATLVNQTKHATNTLRVPHNNWIRDPSASGAIAELNADIGYEAVVGYVDVCSVVEYDISGVPLSAVLDANGQQGANAGGLIKVLNTSDGDHLNATGKATCAAHLASVAPAIFVLPIPAA
jgi:hypothetical protein